MLPEGDIFRRCSFTAVVALMTTVMLCVALTLETSASNARWQPECGASAAVFALVALFTQIAVVIMLWLRLARAAGHPTTSATAAQPGGRWMAAGPC